MVQHKKTKGKKFSNIVISLTYAPAFAFGMELWLFGIGLSVLFWVLYFRYELLVLCRQKIPYFTIYMVAFFIVLSALTLFRWLDTTVFDADVAVAVFLMVYGFLGYQPIWKKIEGAFGDSPERT